MKEKQKAIFKDKILEQIEAKSGVLFYGDNFKNCLGPDLDIGVVLVLINDMHIDGYVEIDDRYRTKDQPNEMRLSLTSKGSFFLEHEGGYKKQQKVVNRRKYFSKEIWVPVISAIVGAAVGSIVTALLSC